MLTAAHLIAAGASAAAAARFVEPLRAACALHSIDTPAQLAAFLAQCGHESGGFSRLVESLAYRDPARLDAMFSAVRGPADACALIAAGDVAIACRVYAGRNGNGDEASGDGWRYRGRGLLQITGRANYAAAAAGCGQPWVERPELLAEPTGAALSAAWYWRTHGCGPLADAGQIDRITRAINGPAMEGAEARRQRWRAVRAAMCIN